MKFFMIFLILYLSFFYIYLFIAFSLILGGILAPFWSLLVSKNMIFSVLEFLCFFVSIFSYFGPKMGPNSINRSVTFSILFRYFSQLFSKGRLGEARGSIFDGFLRILEGFWEDFGGILGIC